MAPRPDARGGPPPAWGDQGRVRNWFHTTAGARFLNLQTRWFRLRSPRGYVVLTTTGRRTGRPRSTCLRAVVSGRDLVLVATSGPTTGWFRNLVADPLVTVRLGRTTRSGRARPVADEEGGPWADTFCRPVFAFDRVASVVNQRGVPTTSRIRDLHERWCRHGAIAVVALDEPPADGPRDRARRGPSDRVGTGA